MRFSGVLKTRQEPYISGLPSIRWSVLLNSGILVAIDAATSLPGLSFSLVDEQLKLIQTLARPITAVQTDEFRVTYFTLDREFFDGTTKCRLLIENGQQHHLSGLIEIMPGRFVGALDHVEDYHLVGWASPLFNTDAFEVELLVDGRAEPAMAPNVFRRDFIQLSAHGGWNGFRLPLPRRALDGQPHELAVRAGDTVLRFGAWATSARIHIDVVEDGRLAGWVCDEALLDAPVTIRLLLAGREIARQRTFGRPDVASSMSRTIVGFDFGGLRILPGLDIAVGAGEGEVLARVARAEFAGRIAALRAENRAKLLGDPDSSATLTARRGLAAIGIALERKRGGRLSVAQVRGERRQREQAGGVQASIDRVSGADKPLSVKAGRQGALVIIPVYKGLADLRLCVESVLPQLARAGCRLVIINDASPERAIHDYLDELSRRREPGVTILTNPFNRGFVETVNRGLMELGPGEDVVLVNADTILPAGGLAKLALACHAVPGIASVTPMSNTATILSFPLQRRPNRPLFGLDVEALDAAFAASAPSPIEIPTGIGFCMYLNRDALDEVGLLSPKWGRGYCEEVEWSLVARDLGWIHIATPDTFVIHEGSVSFGAAERDGILEVNHARLEALFPEYLGEIEDFVRADPVAVLREPVFAQLFAARFRRLTVHVVHSLGGGTRRYVDDLAALPREPDHEFCVVTSGTGDFGMALMRLTLHTARTTLEIDETGLVPFLERLSAIGIDVQLRFNSRLGLSSALLREFAEGSIPYGVTLHDFQWYCPKVTLLNETHAYCGEPSPKVCQLCVRQGEIFDFGDHNDLIRRDIESWIDFDVQFLRAAREIIAPSEDTRDRYRTRLGLADIVVRPHPETVRVALPPGRGTAAGDVVRVAIVGAIGDHKGYEIIEAMAQHAESHALPFYFRIVGYTRDDTRLARLANIDVGGRYEAHALPEQLDAFRPHFVLIASPWPETYSYVLSEVWNAGYPVVSMDLGAPAGRIRETGGGVVVPATRDAGELLRALQGAHRALGEAPARSWTRAAPLTLEDYMESPFAPAAAAPENAQPALLADAEASE